MTAVFAAVKGEDGIVRAEKFLFTDEEGDEMRASGGGDHARPWTWIFNAASGANDAYEGNNHYARWWWDEWERRQRGDARLSYVSDAQEWRGQKVPRCPWCSDSNLVDDDVSVDHPYEEVVSCSSCSQPFVVKRSYVYSTAPLRKE
jgi:hypothetical protein